MQSFSSVLQTWLTKRALAIEDAAARLHLSPRALRYLLDGTSLPHGSTLALIETEVASGAGVSLKKLRDLVNKQRAAKRRGSHGVGRRYADLQSRPNKTGATDSRGSK